MDYNLLLGNVDADGRLVDEILDEEARDSLENLSQLMGSQRLEEEANDNGEDMVDAAVISADAVDSVDYADIDELASDYSKSVTTVDKTPADSDSEEFEDVYDVGSVGDADDQGVDEKAPLSAMLPEEYKDVNPRKMFPEFKKGRVLRFSRLFGEGKPKSLPQIWRGARLRRRAGADEPSTSAGLTSAAAQPFRLNFAPPPPPEECLTDDEVKQCRPEVRTKKSVTSKSKREEAVTDPDDAVAAWRFGPAQFWYDYYGVPEDGKGFNYGIKINKKNQKALEESGPSPPPDLDRTELLPVSLIHWEDDIIWDADEAREQIINKLSSGKQPTCGWIPTQHTRTYQSFMTVLRSGNFASLFPVNPDPAAKITIPTDFTSTEFEPSETNSIFPPDNHDFDDIRWEDDIIWDTENMDYVPKPKILTLDLWDDPQLFGLPEDKVDDDENRMRGSQSPKGGFDRKEHQFTKKSQQILGQVQKRQKEVEDEMIENSIDKTSEKDPFNMSNDEYYLPKEIEDSFTGTSQQLTGVGGSLIQHSTPAMNIQRPFFPTYLNANKLRNWQRALLKRISKGPMSKYTYHGVHSLARHIIEREKERENERQKFGGGDIFFMKYPDDLTARDGELVLCEFSEEHPPIMQQPGMASKIRNYWKRKPGKEHSEPKFEYGETAFTHTSPFLGSLAPGTALQALENNLYRAPIYSHNLPSTDFLIIRNKSGFHLRTVGTVFTVGQICPLYEVPSPNSKRTTNFGRDFLLAFIYRLFWASSDTPKKIRVEDVKKAFPQLAESSVRKRLKVCSDFKRLGPGTELNFWVLKPDFRLPSREEVTAIISPEMCCAHYSMQAAEQRLKDAGYGEKYFFTPAEDEDSEQVTMEDEIKCAPWNTTRAFMMAVKNKCLLDLTGGADPTGCGEGFSYVRVSSKPPKQPKEESEKTQPKKLVTGTDADLRKLSLKDAKQHLRDFGVKEEEINQLTRWEIIDVIRTLSTQQAKSAGENAGIIKFARGNIRYNLGEMKERYGEECQRIFDLQNKMLASEEVLSTDEETSGDDSDIEEMGKDIESMLTGSSKHRAKASFAQEEKERHELQKMLRGEPMNENESKKKKKGDIASPPQLNTGLKGRKLKISRTQRADDGKTYNITEVVTRPELIDAYMKVKTTKDAAFIRAFAQMDDQYKEEKRKEKRRLQDQLRRIRRNEIKAKQQGLPVGFKTSPTKMKPVEARKKTPPPVKESILKMKCSACNGTGHMKTNRNCPLYGKDINKQRHNIAPTDEEIERGMELPAGDLVRVEGTKLRLNKALVEQADKARKKALMLRFPKAIIQKTLPVLSKGHGGKLRLGRAESPPSKKQKQSVSSATSDYEGPKQSVQRRRADPKVTMALQLESIVNHIRNMPQAAHFLVPVNKKQVPDYYRIIEKPMDLQKLRMDVARNVYETREAFLSDVRLIFDNSRLYNGDTSEITKAAKAVFEVACSQVASKESKLMRLEKAINPLLDDNDIVAFSYIFQGILAQCKNLPKSHAFHQRVDAKKVKTYYEKIKIPMDLGTMEQKLKKHQYTTVESFMNDLDQIYINSQLFNGAASLYTLKALEIKDLAESLVKQQEEHIRELEKTIQRALDSAEVESFMTGPSSIAGDPQPAGEDEDTIPFMGGDRTKQSSMPLDFTDLYPKLEAVKEGANANVQQMEAGPSYTVEVDEVSRDTFDDLSEMLDGSAMNRGGQLHADLALSDSDDGDDEGGDVDHEQPLDTL